MKVYLIGDCDDLDERNDLRETFDHIGRIAFSGDSPTLHAQITLLLSSNGVCLLDDWWSTRNGVELQTIAAWLGMKVYNPLGQKVSTKSLKG